MANTKKIETGKKTNETVFKSVYKQEHFRIDGVKYLFRNFKLTILDCSEELEAKILKHRSIELDK